MTQILIFLMLVAITGPCTASCLVNIKKMDKGATVSIWKHTEDKDDTVDVTKLDNLGSITDLFHKESGTIDVVFKDGKFLSMRYADATYSAIKKWDDLSSLEKDCIGEITKRFDIHERPTP